MHKLDVKYKFVTGVFSLLLLSLSVLGASGDIADQPDDQSEVIISKYLQATQTHEDVLRGASMQVNINATVPKLKERGTLRALRKISKVGQITYQLLGFQGDNTVKNQVIGRYLQAEQQSQGDQNLSITPTNYKFKYKGQRPTDQGSQAYVFQLSPRKKRVGLFKGEIWIDTSSCLPVLEKGRLVKNPSIFFKKVDFERGFAIRNGIPVPTYVLSTIDTRLIGRVELNISFSNFEQDNEANTAEDTSESASLTTAPSCK